MKAKVNRRGQLSLPEEARAALRLAPGGGTVEVRLVEGGIEILAPSARHPFLALQGLVRFDGVLDEASVQAGIVAGATLGEPR